MSTQSERNSRAEGKTKMSLLPPLALQRIAGVLTYGATKYRETPDHPNWLKGAPWMETYDSLLRHLSAWRMGEDTDESGHSHLAHAGANILFLLEMGALRPDLDDRPKSYYLTKFSEGKALEKIASGELKIVEEEGTEPLPAGEDDSHDPAAIPTPDPHFEAPVPLTVAPDPTTHPGLLLNHYLRDMPLEGKFKLLRGLDAITSMNYIDGMLKGENRMTPLIAGKVGDLMGTIPKYEHLDRPYWMNWVMSYQP